ncbi:bifunctional helix-turn-helix transcriptional regulator/GNAT family N-acetyltransferase [Gallaecimonas mangrovi]|uniref:bifunctional helix-turn-helix transcriptional regulator/GNAT family N-acetyltransferase n=1 Tax=Gallaecimonas mangrovi TaxID=2291597 RepID=UPI001260197E|nr:GNAT family N-acetyltransferase [Gallaecimonas mangrovi]
MDFYTLAGPMALGSRLRRLAERFTQDAEKIYRHYDVELDPRWFPVFYMLANKGCSGIGVLAEDVGQSHAAVSQVVKAMAKKGLVTVNKQAADGRVSEVSLTAKGQAQAANLAQQCEDVGAVVNSLLAKTQSQLWAELDTLEYELTKLSLFERVEDLLQTRQQSQLALVPFSGQYQEAFKALNVHWISQHWTLEPSDFKALDNPVENIIAKGGYIVMALYQGRAVGSCALIPLAGGDFELAKMAVDENMRGSGIGLMLGEHIIAKARQLGAKRLYLESNSLLVPAVNLYRKLGFTAVKGPASPYQRCNVQMEMLL